MALSDKQILEEIQRGNVVISPFTERNLSSSSYDVTLGEAFYRVESHKRCMYNPYSEKEVNYLWELHHAKRWADLSCKWALKDECFDNISDNDLVIMISPGETILCHTNEFIGGRNKVTTMMKSRSSMGRSFLETCSCSGWGDVGYVNRWTMEIRNNSQHFCIPLIVGRRVAQIVFLPTGATLKSYDESGKYQTLSDFNELKSNWKPSDMLPKMYLDREIVENK